MSTAPICGSRFCPFTACPQCIYQGGVSEDVSAGESGCNGVTDMEVRETMDPTNESAPGGASTPFSEGLAAARSD